MAPQPGLQITTEKGDLFKYLLKTSMMDTETLLQTLAHSRVLKAQQQGVLCLCGTSHLSMTMSC